MGYLHRHSKSNKYARQQTAVIPEFYREVIDPEMQVVDEFHLNNVRYNDIDNITFSSIIPQVVECGRIDFIN